MQKIAQEIQKYQKHFLFNQSKTMRDAYWHIWFMNDQITFAENG